MASFNIFRRGGSAMSGILNVLGMAVAFAAFYIILVQVDYDLNFNKGIKDSEKIFSVTAGDMDGSGKRQMNFCRPLADIIIDCSPNIEAPHERETFVIGCIFLGILILVETV